MAVYSTPSIGKERREATNVVGTVVSLTGVTCEEFGGNGIVRQTVLTFTNYTPTFTDDGATGHIAVKIYDFPDGVILILGSVIDAAYTSIGGSAGNLQIGLGTTATADATISSTDANICPASSASATNGDSQSTAVAFLNGASTAVDMYVNIGTSGDPGTGATVTINGTATVTWINLGDNA